jgi:segregation and condensation protein B
MLQPSRLGPGRLRPYSVRPPNTAVPLVLRLGRPNSDAPPQAIDPLGRDPKLARVEAALMLADEPISLRRIAEAAELKDGKEARKCLEQLTTFYEAEQSPFQIVEIAGGFQLHTQTQYHPWLVRLRRTGHEARLTPATMETLAVIAYKQPIMRAEIEKIRGVSCSELIRLLIEKGLIRIVGRHDSLGRPQLYGTTKRFLQLFGLNSIENLPQVAALPSPK